MRAIKLKDDIMEVDIEKIIQAEIAGKIIGSIKPEEIVHYWEIHGRGLCKETVW